MVLPIIPSVRVVLDTNVLVAGLRSQLGASHQVLRLAGTGRFEHVVSVALVLEYEDVCKRRRTGVPLTDRQVDAVIDYLCATGVRQEIFFLWRPQLRDPGDDLVLEVAANAGCSAVVTFNGRDFAGAERFGVRPITPQQLLAELGEKR